MALVSCRHGVIHNHLLTHWPTDWLTDWLTHSLTHSLTHPFTHSLIHSFTHYLNSDYHDSCHARLTACIQKMTEVSLAKCVYITTDYLSIGDYDCQLQTFHLSLHIDCSSNNYMCGGAMWMLSWYEATVTKNLPPSAQQKHIHILEAY